MVSTSKEIKKRPRRRGGRSHRRKRADEEVGNGQVGIDLENDEKHESEYEVPESLFELESTSDAVGIDSEFAELREVYSKFIEKVDSRPSERNSVPGENAHQISTAKDSDAEHSLSSSSDSDYNSVNAADRISRKVRSDLARSSRESRRVKKLGKQRIPLAELKEKAERPDLIEPWDANAKDPLLLAQLKAAQGSVQVPEHWRLKRKYLQVKRGLEKTPYELPAFLLETKVAELRAAQNEAELRKSLKQRQREKARPKTAGAADARVLRDAFFRFQTKPALSQHGELYYELREADPDTSSMLKHFRPGILSDELRTALGMPKSSEISIDNPIPVPWIFVMQRIGPPPSFPQLVIPGVTAPPPANARLGYHPFGWGTPSVQFYLAQYQYALSGVHEVETTNKSRLKELLKPPVRESLVDGSMKLPVWGEMVHVAEVDEGSEDEEVDVREAEVPPVSEEEEDLEEIVAEQEEHIQLRKRAVNVDVGGENSAAQLYTVLPAVASNVKREDFMGTTHTYAIPPQKKNPG